MSSARSPVSCRCCLTSCPSPCACHNVYLGEPQSTLLGVDLQPCSTRYCFFIQHPPFPILYYLFLLYQYLPSPSIPSVSDVYSPSLSYLKAFFVYLPYSFDFFSFHFFGLFFFLFFSWTPRPVDTTFFLFLLAVFIWCLLFMLCRWYLQRFFLFVIWVFFFFSSLSFPFRHFTASSERAMFSVFVPLETTRV